MRPTLRRFTAALLALMAAALPPSSASGATVIKLGTVAPEGSIWHDAILRLREAWRERSQGAVELRVYAGGVLGGEDELVRKLQRRVIDAVTLSGAGLPLLDGSFDCLNVPMLFETAEQLDFARDRLAPAIEARLEKKGFRVLNWAVAGTVRFFTRRPVRLPDDLRAQRLCTTSGMPRTEKLYRDFGVHVVPLPATEMLTALQTGLVDAIAVPPLFALLDRSYQIATHLTDLNWATLNAATVVSAEAWGRIPGSLQPSLLAAGRELAASLRDAGRRAEEEAIRQMQSRGLTVVTLTPDDRARWRTETEKGYPALRGAFCPADLFDQALRFREEYRRSAEIGAAAR